MKSISVITTFNQSGLEQYGQRMIDTFDRHWPQEIKLYVYYEKCTPVNPNPERIIFLDLDTVAPLTEFKEKWRDVPKANGDVSRDQIRSKRRDAGKGFKWHAVRFSHKVYAIFDCAARSPSDTLVWMDADTVCHSTIALEKVHALIPDDKDLCYLGRKGKFSEFGLYSMNLNSKFIKKFLLEFQRVYDDAENGIFLMDEWHDSFVFDQVRKRIPGINELNWSEHLGDLRPGTNNSAGEGHPLINSEWGAYLDHLKGERKKLGRSKREDLKVSRKERYWQS